MNDELDPMWARASVIMGEHTCKEIIEGVWEHTWTPRTGTPGIYDWWVSLPGEPCNEPVIYAPKKRRTWPFARICRQWEHEVKDSKRERRQHRATFRRRKRGLA